MIIERIFLAPEPCGALVEVPRARVLAGAGIEGDRYFNAKDEPGQNITLVEAEVIDEFNANFGTIVCQYHKGQQVDPQSVFSDA